MSFWKVVTLTGAICGVISSAASFAEGNVGWGVAMAGCAVLNYFNYRSVCADES